MMGSSDGGRERETGWSLRCQGTEGMAEKGASWEVGLWRSQDSEPSNMPHCPGRIHKRQT